MEDDFNAKIDEDWYEQTTRLVFADWLDEQDDPRAAGYRAIAQINFVPFANDLNYPLRCTVADYRIDTDKDYFKADQSNLPLDWYEMLLTLLPKEERPENKAQRWFSCRTRQEAEELVVKAFLLLTPKQQSEIL